MPEENDQDINYEEESNESGEVDVKDKLKKLHDKLKLCLEEKQNYLTGWQREKADFINYKRRQEEQMGEWAKMLGDGLIKEILPVLDTLDASLVQLGAEENSKPPNPPLRKGGEEEGLRLVRDQLMKALLKHGLMEMKTVGEKFDPEIYEAVEIVEVDGAEEGIVLEEAQKGYLLNGKVLRTAKVKVGK